MWTIIENFLILHKLLVSNFAAQKLSFTETAVAEFELAFTRGRNNLNTVRNLTVRNSLQDFDAVEKYLHPKCRSVLF